uniref:NADH-ubiquinone oxidoreductase chain 3 n=1 Tax=Scaphidium quadrimaculatum TaxID=295644 RepID=A0A0S2M898_SCAQU|nr:NADH dehydrogenase subunit 3 [Scaphidium quadrimaculatum]ALO70890.1 NADH deshydrogenase subunit 3 [Scaphidium quadrimaculatum]
MLMLTIMAIFFFMISFILMNLALMISKKTFLDREKISPFECGFDPKSSARLPFSIQFFLIAMIFIIFDVELALLLPLIMTLKISNIMNFMMISMFFIIILIIGLYHEWNQGTLNWLN